MPRSSLVVLLAGVLAAQKPTGDRLAVDPFTNGDPAAMAAVGIEAYAPFPWADDHSTRDIDIELGAELRVTRAWEISRVSVSIGVATGFTAIRELPGPEFHSTWLPAFHVGPVAGVALDFADGWRVGLEATAAGYLVSDDHTYEITLDTELGMGAGLQVARRF